MSPVTSQTSIGLRPLLFARYARSPLRRFAPSLHMVPPALPETITPCCTLPMDDAHDNTDIVTDAADQEPRSLSLSPMSHLRLNPGS
jgi:hypothetical protein